MSATGEKVSKRIVVITEEEALEKLVPPEVRKQAQEYLSKAKVLLALEQPFFATVAFNLPLVETLSIQTMATDGKNIYWNPMFVGKLNREEVLMGLCHEAMHVVLKHMFRRGHRKQDKWNKACDHPINLILKNGGFQVPAWALCDSAFDGMAAEDVYNKLPNEKQQEDGNGEGDGNGQGKPGKGGKGRPTGKGHVMGGGCEVIDYPYEDGETEQDANAKVDVIIKQAEQVARSRGIMPAGLEDFLAKLNDYRADYHKVLEQFLMAAVTKGDTSWMRPSRRMLAAGWLMPGWVPDRQGKVVICIDSSGSVGDKELQEFLAWLNGIIERLRIAETTVIGCDAAVGEVKTYTPEDLPIQGDKFIKLARGGTSFKPPFKWVEKHFHGKPDALVYLTDLEGDFPDEPSYPVMWISTTDHKAPWGITCKMEI